jgi:hypothetical protein
MSIEAMKQALDALKKAKDDADNYLVTSQQDVRIMGHIVSLIEAELAKPEQEPVAWMVRDSIDGSWYPCAFENPAGAIKGESKPLYAVPQQAEKQEPIAWMVYTLDGASAFVTDNPNDFTELHSCFALYTAPPRKEWVGLTELEINHYNSRLSGSGVAEEIQAKLRERNT